MVGRIPCPEDASAPIMSKKKKEKKMQNANRTDDDALLEEAI